MTTAARQIALSWANSLTGSPREHAWRWWIAALLGIVALPLAAQTALLEGVVSISAGGTGGAAHTCAIRQGGDVWCWGENANGQVGDGSRAARVLATPVIGLGEKAVALATGSEHSCMLSESGGVYCWGANDFGQLGVDGPDASVPVQVTLPAAAVSIAAGGAHTCAALAGGGVSCWGINESGTLGTADAVDFNVTVAGLPAPALRVAAGGGTSCALLQTGEVYCWGLNNVGQASPASNAASVTQPTAVTGLQEPAVAIDAGGFQSCALGSSGAVRCWGNGQGVAPSALVTSGAVGVSVGNFFFACARMADGSVQCAGWNTMGQLGRGTVTHQELIGPVADLSGVDAVDAGFWHACAVVAGGVRCWGESAYGQLGNGDDSRVTAPTRVELGAATLTRIAAGGDHSCGLRLDGRVLCWGYNLQAELGDGTLVSRALPALAATAGGRTYSALALGSAFSCALAQDATVDCWGSDVQGQLGNGSSPYTGLPGTVSGLSGVVKLDAGLFAVCAATQDGAAYCWGANFTGELGDGTTIDRDVPTLVSGLGPGAGVIEVKPGYGHSCALLAGGAVKCWGSNLFGALGSSSESLPQSLVPVQVPGLESGVASIATGYGLSCALMNGDRSVRCWGVFFGPVPTTVAGLESGVLEIAAFGGNRISDGQTQLCARMTGGELRCVGSNKFGQLGDGSRLQSLSAVKVGGVDSAPVVAVGEHHACVVMPDGSARCWGGNAQGQLGTGRRGVMPLPGVVRYDTVRPLIVSPSTGGNGASLGAVSDASGRYVVFQSAASNLTGAPDGNGATDVFRVDLQTGATVLVSVNDDESPGSGGAMEPAVSATGQLVAFVAPDTSLTKLHGESVREKRARLKAGGFGVFLRDLVTGTSQRIGSARPGGSGTQPQVSPNGNSIAYTAPVTTGAQGAVGQENVFRVPVVIQGGVPKPGEPECITCKARTAIGLPADDSDGASRNPVLSADGQWLAYETEAKNQTAGVPSPCPGPTTEVMLRNLITGVAQRVSPAPGTPVIACGSAGSGAPSIDWTADHLAFESDLPVEMADRNGLRDVYLVDLQTGVPERVSVDPQTGNDGLSVASRPRLSGNGRQISYVSQASNAESSEPDNNATTDVLVYAPEVKRARRVSNNRRGDQAVVASGRPSMNYDGTYVLFDSAANNLQLHAATGQPTDTNGALDVYRSVSPYQTRGGPETILLDGFESP